ncbi:uncharacterized protein LOC115826966 isoform X2 [Chanos chanos]|nr:uncharacterized protein LOC115826966 isoform X2 [Chanos chanos]
MVLKARDVCHYERVMEFLDVTYRLLPRLVTPIKHMKIMFGLKTLVIMWMLQDNQCVTNISDKIIKFFPDSLPQYNRCSQRHKELMRKNQQDFRDFAQTLARDKNLRKAYIRDLMEDQYGERYSQKLEERLFYYLGELEAALPETTCIDQVLKQSWPLTEGEELLRQLLSCNRISLPQTLKRLLHCAKVTHTSLCDSRPNSTGKCKPGRESGAVPETASRQCQEGPQSETVAETSITPSYAPEDSRTNRDAAPVLPQRSLGHFCSDHKVAELERDSSQTPEVLLDGNRECLLREEEASSRGRRWGPSQTAEGLAKKQEEGMNDSAIQICSTHRKQMRSILQECSEESVYNPASPQNNKASPPHQPVPQHNRPSPLHQLTPEQNTPSSPHQSVPQHNTPPPPHQSITQNDSTPEMSLLQRSTSKYTKFPVQDPDLRSVSPAQRFTLSPVSPISQLTPLSLCTVKQPMPLPAPPVRQLTPASVSAQDCSKSIKSSEVKLRLSSESLVFLMHSHWFQPHVCLRRLNQQEFGTVTALDETGICPIEQEEQEEVEEEEEGYLAFDINTLYSDSSTDSDSGHSDPDYVP